MKNWFESWFDTKYYHILYRDRDENEAKFFMQNISKNLNINSSHKLLDLACGKGRHAMFLNSLGYDVVGVDLSKASIESAKQTENERLKFFTHDMRLPMHDHQFDFVFNLFTSIGYFENEQDNIKTLQSVHSYLNPNGVLVIDFLNEHKVRRELEPYTLKSIDGIDFHIEKSIVNGIIEKKITFTDQEKSYCFEEKVHALTLDNFKSYCEAARFEIIKYSGDYHLSDFDIENSDRLIIFAKKIN